MVSSVLPPISDSHFIVHYFPIRGLGESIRILLEVAGVSYENAFPTDWNKEKANYPPFHQLPILVERNAQGEEVLRLAQSSAIVRYIAARAELDGGADLILKAKLESFVESLLDARTAYNRIYYNSQLDVTAKQVAFEQYFNEVFPKFLAAHEQILQGNGGNGFYHGNQFSYVEFLVFNWLDTIRLTHKEVIDKALAEVPAVQQMMAQVMRHPKVADYLASDRRMQK